MNPLNRRRVLLGLAAATSGAAVLAATAVDEARAETSTESPALLALADELPAVVAEYDAARVRRETAVAVGKALWPVADDALADDFDCWSRYERDVRGAAIQRPGEPRPRTLVTAESLQWRLLHVEKSMNRKRTKFPLPPDALMGLEAERAQLLDLLAIAQDYEARKAKALASSGYADAQERFNAAELALVAAVEKTMNEPAKSLTGIVVKAEAMRVWARLDPLIRLTAQARGDWSEAFAAELLAIAGGAVQPS